MSLTERMKKYAELDAARTKGDWKGVYSVMHDGDNAIEILMHETHNGYHLASLANESDHDLFASAPSIFTDLQTAMRALGVAMAGLVACELEFDRLRTQSGMYYAEKGLKIARPALKTINELLGEK